MRVFILVLVFILGFVILTKPDVDWQAAPIQYSKFDTFLIELDEGEELWTCADGEVLLREFKNSENGFRILVKQTIVWKPTYL